MIVNIELEVDDDPIYNRIPTEEEKRLSSTSWLQCERCGSTTFHNLTRKPQQWHIHGKMTLHHYYNEKEDQAAVAMRMCIGCKRLVLVA